MLKMAVGQSDEFDPGIALGAALEQCRLQLAGAVPKAAIVFSAFDSFDSIMVRLLRTEFPGIQLIGSTSAAEMSSVGGYQEDSVTLALLVSDSVDFTTGMATIDIDLEGACRQAAQEALAATAKPPGCASCSLMAWMASGHWRLSDVRFRTTSWLSVADRAARRSAGGHPSRSSTTT